MVRRKVTKTRKDQDGDITALCNSPEWWSPISKDSAIEQIEKGTHSYYVSIIGKGEVDIHVAKTSSGKKYLRTDKDKTTKNNLDELPNC